MTSFVSIYVTVGILILISIIIAIINVIKVSKASEKISFLEREIENRARELESLKKEGELSRDSALLKIRPEVFDEPETESVPDHYPEPSYQVQNEPEPATDSDNYQYDSEYQSYQVTPQAPSHSDENLEPVGPYPERDNQGDVPDYETSYPEETDSRVEIPDSDQYPHSYSGEGPVIGRPDVPVEQQVPEYQMYSPGQEMAPEDAEMPAPVVMADDSNEIGDPFPAPVIHRSDNISMETETEAPDISSEISESDSAFAEQPASKEYLQSIEQNAEIPVSLYSEVTQDVDIASVWEAIQPKLSQDIQSRFRIDCQNVLFLYQAEIQNLKKMLTTISGRNGAVSFVNISPELEPTLRRNSILSSPDSGQ